MVADRSDELQVAITAALKADATVTTRIAGRIYDRSPQSVTLPYATVSDDIGEPYDGTGLDGWEQLVRVDIWSRDGGRSREAKLAAAAINDVLHDKALTLSAGNFVNGRMLPGGQQMMRESDGETVHIIQRFRFVTND